MEKRYRPTTTDCPIEGILLLLTHLGKQRRLSQSPCESKVVRSPQRSFVVCYMFGDRLGMGEFDPELLASQREPKVDDRLDSKVAQHQGYGSSRTDLGELVVDMEEHAGQRGRDQLVSCTMHPVKPTTAEDDPGQDPLDISLNADAACSINGKMFDGPWPKKREFCSPTVRL
ncbi:hypothetical protein PGT21_001131 [Puccinia graminis f. sp. tritici]|uniref:Uncharacterized protein n=1 Tax=Puccinia graminis f. sp. tritici TaxID=56615 RepID=A0A5B0NNN9_PUCGR|nr:hypothetical protein PGT21_001131 [Puccinia graminis f. sp. tritici]